MKRLVLIAVLVAATFAPSAPVGAATLLPNNTSDRLKLAIVGMVGWVPDQNGNEALGLLVNAATHSPKHHAALVVRCADLTGKTKATCDSWPDAEGEDKEEGWKQLSLADGWDLSFRFAKADGKWVEPRKASLDIGWSKWVGPVPLAEAAPGHDQILHSLLKPTIKDDTGLVAVRFRLKSGTLNALKCNGLGARRPWFFSPSWYRQGDVCEGAILEVENDEGFAIHFTPQPRNRAEEFDLEFVPGTVFAAIINEPTEADFCQVEPGPNELWDHFGLYYKLSLPNGPLPASNTAKECCPRGKLCPRGLKPVICMQAAFAPEKLLY